MRVYTYPSDRTGCGSYRLIWVARVLRAQGHDVVTVIPRDRTGDSGLNGMQDEAGNLVSVDIPPDADVMVFQRVTLGQLAQAVPLIRAKGVAVVVDTDDDLTTAHPYNRAWQMMHPKYGRPGHSWHHHSIACRDATMVTVSTPALLRVYAQHGRGRVVENCVPARYLEIPHQDSDLVGWGGVVASHPDDLQTMGLAVRRVLDGGGRFRHIGEAGGVKDALGLAEDPECTGTVDITTWPTTLAGLGVGVAPLADSAFNRAKSFLKILEYSATGVPWVASPRAEYRRFLHAHPEVGLLAEKPREWYRQITALTGDPGRRAEMSAAGRAAAATRTIEGNAWRWWAAWEEAWQLQRASIPVVSRA